MVKKLLEEKYNINFILKNIVEPRIIRVAVEFYYEFGELKGLGQILHELIKRELIRICQEIGLMPFPEIVNPKKEDEGDEKLGRVDILFLDDEEYLPVFVFEIDQGINKESIKKLRMHGEIIARCIILFGELSPKQSLLDKDIYYIDVTQEKLFKRLNS